MISSKTSFIALIGNPVSHSLSPIMQNAALKYLVLDLIYIAVPCKNEDLELVLNSFKKINSSFNFSNPLTVIGSFSIFYLHFATGGSDIKIASTLPLVCKPNFVPLS